MCIPQHAQHPLDAMIYMIRLPAEDRCTLAEYIKLRSRRSTVCSRSSSRTRTGEGSDKSDLEYLAKAP